MTEPSDDLPADSRRRRPLATALMWLLALGLLAFLCAWPLIGHMVAANDDLKFIRGAENAGSFAADVRFGWAQAANFRPLENFAALFCEAHTLECRGVIAIQVLGLLVLAAGVIAIARRLLPAHPAAAPLMLIWLALSPGTTASLWQMDTCSQTWSAALGVWAGLLAYDAVTDGPCRKRLLLRLGLLTLLCALAVNVKETFYGWSAGIGVALIIAAAALCKCDRQASLRSLLALAAVGVLPALHLLYRLKFAGLGAASQVTGEIEARYEIILGANLARNAWLALLGVFSNGPLHLVNDVAAPLVLRALPLATLVAAFIAIAASGGLALVHRKAHTSLHRRAILLTAVAILLSLSVTLPMGSVSELYGMGANVGSGLLIASALLSLWRPAQPEERALCRVIAAGCAGVILLVGAYGLISRAQHFRLTWTYARELNRIVLAHQRSLTADARPGVIYFDRPCTMAAIHNQYVIAPVQALGLEDTLDWMNRMDPERKVLFAVDRPLGNPHPRDLLLDCRDLPPRGHW